MKNKILLAILALIAYPLFLQGRETVRVAVAANMQFVVRKIKTDFEKETGIGVEVIPGASGKLAAQIKEGAPFDVFVSADLIFPQDLFKSGYGAQEPKTYGTGMLVLWTTKTDLIPETSLSLLLKPGIRKIAVANPKTAPYGLAAEEALKFYNLYDRVKPKLVFGENIGQAQQFVATGAADIGFVAKSLVLGDDLNEKGRWVDIDPKSYNPIVQGALLLKHGTEAGKSAATRFYDYLFSTNAKQILARYGFIVR